MLPAQISIELCALLMLAAGGGALLTTVLGAGGGLVLLVVLAQWIPPAVLIPVHGLVQMGANLGRAGLTFRHIDWRVVAAFLPGVLAGAWLASQFLVQLPEAVWQSAIALFVLWMCWGPALPRLALGSIGIAIAALFTSFASFFVGASGPLVAAFIKQLDRDRFQTIATFAACMSLQHAPKAIAFGAVGFVLADWWLLIALLILATFLGNLIGVRLLGRLSDRRFHFLFNLALTLLAVRLLWQALPS